MKKHAIISAVASAVLVCATSAMASTCPPGDTCTPNVQQTPAAASTCPPGDTCTPNVQQTPAAASTCPPGDTCTPSSNTTNTSSSDGVVSDVKTVGSIAHTAANLGHTLQGVASAFNGL